MVSPITGSVAGTILTVLIVAIEQEEGGEQFATLSEMVPEGPLPQITVAESLVDDGAGKNTPPVTDQL
jgi:hypothetical protein